MRTFGHLCAFLFLIFIFMCGCQRGEQTAGKPTIALVVKTVNHPFFVDMQNGAEEAAKRLGVDVIVQGAEREVDVEKQMQIIENLIQRKVDAICIDPSGSKEIIPAILKADKAEIPVLIVDTRIDTSLLNESGGFVETFIGSDNEEGGRIAGNYILNQLGGRGKVAVLEGIPGHETSDARLRGFHSALDQAPGMEIVVSLTANWERDQGFTVFQNILQSHPEVQALFACNDLMALGAIEAVEAAGKTGEIIIVGFDALDDAKKAILKGTMHGSVAQHPSEMGRIAIESAYRLINGERIEKNIPVRIELMTRDNLDVAGIESP
ncbi:sugar ABC transporter substrate-binding protein [bacterium]|nr:sugar ABC transporter substrate-binding protein [bacterium]RQV93800.1 MAG: D-ribose ABC transporter substrate-binding protein [bacterium]